MMMRTNCLGSLRAALKDAGLDDRCGDIPAGMMAERLRPRPQTRAQPTDLSNLVTPAVEPVRRGRLSSVSVWVLLLAFALGLIPSLAIGAVLWLEQSRNTSASPCSLQTAVVLTLPARV